MFSTGVLAQTWKHGLGSPKQEREAPKLLAIEFCSRGAREPAPIRRTGSSIQMLSAAAVYQ